MPARQTVVTVNASPLGGREKVASLRGMGTFLGKSTRQCLGPSGYLLSAGALTYLSQGQASANSDSQLPLWCFMSITKEGPDP